MRPASRFASPSKKACDLRIVWLHREKGVALRIRTKLVGIAATLGALLVALPVAAAAPPKASSLAAYYPDLRTVVPQHLNLVNSSQQEILRFSNGIANTGPGPWALRPDPFPGDAGPTTTTIDAVQEFRSSNTPYRCGEQPKSVSDCYDLVGERVAGTFEFHPAHNHWHIGDVALFEVRVGNPYTGPIVGGNSLKTTFCLIDSYALVGNSATSQRVFWDCYAGYQGIRSGWVDQYHQSTPGQQLDLTGIPNGNDYYLVSTSNYDRVFTEADYANNTAWVRFSLSQGSKGNRKVEVIGTSLCEPASGLCGISTNR